MPGHWTMGAQQCPLPLLANGQHFTPANTVADPPECMSGSWRACCSRRLAALPCGHSLCGYSHARAAHGILSTTCGPRRDPETIFPDCQTARLPDCKTSFLSFPQRASEGSAALNERHKTGTSPPRRAAPAERRRDSVSFCNGVADATTAYLAATRPSRGRGAQKRRAPRNRHKLYRLKTLVFSRRLRLRGSPGPLACQRARCWAPASRTPRSASG